MFVVPNSKIETIFYMKSFQEIKELIELGEWEKLSKDDPVEIRQFLSDAGMEGKDLLPPS